MDTAGVIRADTAVVDPAPVGRAITILVAVESERADLLDTTRARFAASSIGASLRPALDLRTRRPPGPPRPTTWLPSDTAGVLARRDAMLEPAWGALYREWGREIFGLGAPLKAYRMRLARPHSNSEPRARL